MSQAICVKCGAQLEEGFKFCMKCGAPSTPMRSDAPSPDFGSTDPTAPPAAVTASSSSGTAVGGPDNAAEGNQTEEGKKGVFGKLFGRDKKPYSQAESAAQEGRAPKVAGAVQGETSPNPMTIPPVMTEPESAAKVSSDGHLPNQGYGVSSAPMMDDDSEADATIDFETFIAKPGVDDYDDEPTTVLVPTYRPLLRRQSTGNVLYFDVPAVVGKGSRATCRISGNPAISREHVRIEQEGDEYFLIDTCSTNGTWLDGQRLTADRRVSLREGSILTLADEDFTFALEEE